MVPAMAKWTLIFSMESNVASYAAEACYLSWSVELWYSSRMDNKND